jgi:hypothetical protein
MPTGSEFKQIVRARMDVTGEKYTVAMRAVLKAARAAIPYSRTGRHDSLSGLALASSSKFLATHNPASSKDQRKGDGDIRAALADFCEYQAAWRAESTLESPEDEAAANNASRHLMACAEQLRSIPPNDPRVLVIANSWANKDTLGLMQSVEGSVIGEEDFDLTAEELIDLLAAEAIKLVADPEAG